MAVARHIENFVMENVYATNVIPRSARIFLNIYFFLCGPVYEGKRISETRLGGTPMYCALACFHL